MNNSAEALAVVAVIVIFTVTFIISGVVTYRIIRKRKNRNTDINKGNTEKDD